MSDLPLVKVPKLLPKIDKADSVLKIIDKIDKVYEKYYKSIKTDDKVCSKNDVFRGLKETISLALDVGLKNFSDDE